MRRPVYNSAILKMKPATCAFPVALYARATLRVSFFLVLLFPVFGLSSTTTNWSDPEQQLARKIVAITGPGAVALTVDNHSSLNKKQSDIVGNGLRSALEAIGIRFVAADQAAATVAITLSENQTSYVWVAEIHQGAGESAVVMVSTPREEGISVVHESVPLTLTKTSIWKQPERILDVAILEENAFPSHIAVLNGERVTLYRWRGEKWDQEQSLAIAHARPWPRDLRGRLVPAKDHLLDVYLPGVLCQTTSRVPLTLNCRESDDPWPLLPPALIEARVSSADFSYGSNKAAFVPLLNAFFASTRNFFTGVVSPHIGKFSAVPKFYSLAFVPHDKYVLWIFATTDGSIHMVDGVSDVTLKPGLNNGWNSDLTTVHTSCGAGWQVLAITSDDANNRDSIRAYEFPDRDPVAVSAAVDLQGEVTALWTEAKGDSAIAVDRDRETGGYEAFRLSVACGQ